MGLPAGWDKLFMACEFKGFASRGTADEVLSGGRFCVNLGKELQAAQKGRQIDLNIGQLPNCSGDPSLLKPTIFNILEHAFKYTGQCDRALIEVGSMEHEGATVYFVRDNGVGFDMRYADKLFGVFQRLHRPAELEDTGIGLTLAQSIRPRHGGEIWVEAEVNKGAVFYFTIDVKPLSVSCPDSRRFEAR